MIGLGQAAHAQDGGNARALDALGSPHHPTSAHHGPLRHHPSHHSHHQHATTQAQATTATPAPAIPAGPPAAAMIKPIALVVPQHPEPPPPVPPVVATARGSTREVAGGAEITFGPGSTDLNSATMAAVIEFAGELHADETARGLVDAYAKGTADDPSSPRRMALSRGLAVRAVLISHGIASTRIYVRAIGAPPEGPSSGGDPDRVDLIRSDSLQQRPAAP